MSVFPLRFRVLGMQNHKVLYKNKLENGERNLRETRNSFALCTCNWATLNFNWSHIIV